MISLRKASSRRELEETPALWWPRTAESGKRSAYFSCPGCGEWFDLDRWLIFEDGTVQPSVDHSWPVKRGDGSVIPSCKFHDRIQLLDWL
jgi:hypothetical protein